MNGYAEGKGTLTWFVNGKPYATYEGELKGGHYDGEGTQIWPSGARYDGGWKATAPTATALTAIRKAKSVRGCGSMAAFRAAAIIRSEFHNARRDVFDGAHVTGAT